MQRSWWNGALGVGLLVATWGIPVAAAEAPSVGPTPETKSISLIQLIASPAEYDGQRVAVAGFCNIEFEGNAVYLHEEDYRYALRVNAVRLELPDSVPAAFRKAHHRYAMLEGVFVAGPSGAPGYRGRIRDITRLETIPAWATHPRRAPGK